MMTGRKRLRNPAEYLADDLIIDILARLTERPLCRFKCVSRSWRDLISGPVHRRRLAHTDAASGFFHHVHGYGSLPLTNLNFTALCPPDGGGGSPPPPPLLDQAFPFLASDNTRTKMELLDSCNGLPLLRCHHASDDYYNLKAPLYIVCNPTSQGWAVELPPSPLLEIERRRRGRAMWQDLDFARRERLERHRRESTRPAALAFDPAFSTHFHVFELEEEEDGHNSPCGPAIKAVRIYSSETGEWVRRDSDWSYRIDYAGKNAYLSDTKWCYRVAYAGKHAYLNGFLHLTTTDTKNGMVVVASVDTMGQTWRATRVCPEPPATLGAPGVIGHSQRRLLYVDAGGGSDDAHKLSVYALENRGGAAERWILKHSARTLDRSEQTSFGKHHSVVGIHPDSNVIFLFDCQQRSLIAYDMDRGTRRIVRSFPDATSNFATATAREYHFVPYIPPYLQ